MRNLLTWLIVSGTWACACVLARQPVIEVVPGETPPLLQHTHTDTRTHKKEFSQSPPLSYMLPLRLTATSASACKLTVDVVLTALQQH